MSAQSTDIRSEMRERELLGAIMLDNSQVKRLTLRPADFTSVAHGQIFETTVRMVNQGSVADALTVAEALERDTKRKDWLQLTAAMVRECLAPKNASDYAALIRDSAISRRAAAIGRDLTEGGNVADAIRALMELTATQKSHECTISDALSLAVDEIDKATEGKSSGLRTGMRDLDDGMGGLHKQDLIVIAARPAMGKTAFMLNLACNVDVPMGIISAEQGRSQIAMRMLGIDGGVSLHSMRNGKVRGDEWHRVTTAMNTLRGRPIRINDRPGVSIDEIIEQARQWKFHNGIGLLMIDYLQKIQGGRGKDFRLQVGNVTVELKNLARELDIPVVTLAQVNRAVEARPLGEDGMGRMPYMGDIAESAIIEQEADQVITLYRPEVYEERAGFEGLAFANACKNRHGPIGFKRMHWHGEHLKFSDMAKTEYSAYEDAA